MLGKIIIIRTNTTGNIGLTGKNGEVYGVKIPFKYVLEMVADFIGAGKIYNKGNWNRHMPLDYHLKTKDNRVFHEDTLKLLTSLFEIIDVYDLKNWIEND